jgi:hypothetical protein
MRTEMNGPPHPSYLELDKLAVGAGSELARQHVAACKECTAHVERVQAPAPLPEWVRNPQGVRAGARAWIWSWQAAVAGVCAVALIAVGVGTLTNGTGPAHQAYQVKGGTPGLAIFVKRGETVEAWDGHRSIRTGDSLRLQVAPEGFAHITVDSPSSPGAPLFDGPLSAATDFLPVSWRVDDQQGDEILEITLSGPGLPPWHSRMVLPKNATP